MEIRKNKNWLPTDMRFVALIDILGFKDLVMRSTHSEIYDLLTEISKLRVQIDNWKDESDGRFSNSGVYTISFSDSILVFSKSNTIEDFDLFIYTVNWLFSEAIIKSIPLKGALAYGEISLNKSSQIYFGQPIIDAYLLQEEVNYFGIVAHNSIERYYYNNKEESFHQEFLVEIKTPLKCGIISHLNLLWFGMFQDDKNLEEVVKKFQNNVSGSPRRYIDNTLTVLESYFKNRKE